MIITKLRITGWHPKERNREEAPSIATRFWTQVRLRHRKDRRACTAGLSYPPAPPATLPPPRSASMVSHARRQILLSAHIPADLKTCWHLVLSKTSAQSGHTLGAPRHLKNPNITGFRSRAYVSSRAVACWTNACATQASRCVLKDSATRAFNRRHTVTPQYKA